MCAFASIGCCFYPPQYKTLNLPNITPEPIATVNINRFARNISGLA